MKIGILTWYFGYNYGAEAHSYALMKVLEKMGHDVRLIKYRPANSFKIDITSNLNITNRKKHPILLIRCLIRCLKFFIEKRRYNTTPRVKTSDDIKRLGLDYIVLGSDEILNVHHQIHDFIYYGVGLEDENCIFYAPSAGQTDSTENLPDKVKKSISFRQYISGRDYNTVKLLQKYTTNTVELVLDPTLLYEFNDFSFVPRQRNNYILIYAFSEWAEYKKQILDYAKKYRMEIVSIRRYYKWADYNYDMCSLNQWIGMFRNASLVFTDSFHGLIFAIKNRKDFVIVSRSDKVNKIQNLEQQFEIERPFLDVGISIESYIKEYPINYDVIEKQVESLRVKSINYLYDALKANARGC